MRLIFSTNNKHKLEEIIQMTGDEYQVLGLKDVNINEDIPETQETLEGNAIQKAMFIYEKYGYNCFADDTGLEIDALNDRPGVYSARYAGPDCSATDNVHKILDELQDTENRKAKFRTVIALVENGKVFTFEGMVEGSIIRANRGTDGFGYDPVFLPDGYNQTFAEMNLAQKNSISHRARALKKFISFLKNRNNT